MCPVESEITKYCYPRFFTICKFLNSVISGFQSALTTNYDCVSLVIRKATSMFSMFVTAMNLSSKTLSYFSSFIL